MTPNGPHNGQKYVGYNTERSEGSLRVFVPASPRASLCVCYAQFKTAIALLNDLVNFLKHLGLGLIIYRLLQSLRIGISAELSE